MLTKFFIELKIITNFLTKTKNIDGKFYITKKCIFILLELKTNF